MAGPFEGLRVVEFGRFIAAPYCAQLLADGGADVIKVEPLRGDETRHIGQVIEGEGRQYLNKNRGKRSIAVDLNEQEVRGAVQRIAAGADVIVANFRPGQSERLGLDYASLSATNSRLIYAENTAFGRKGPKANDPGMDLMMAAYSGITPSGPDGPVDLENPVIDYMAAMSLAWGVSTALYHRERTGDGQRIDVSLLQSALVVQNNFVNHIDVIDSAWRRPFVEKAKKALAEGATWREVADIKAEMMPHAFQRAYYGFYRTSDGFIAIAAPAKGLRERVVKVLEIEDLWVTEPGWLPDDGLVHVRKIRAAVEEKLLPRGSGHWISLLHGAGIPVAEVRLRDEIIDDEQAAANDYFVELEHDLVGSVKVVAPPVKFSETPLEAKRASPVLGNSTADVLREAGLTSDDVKRLAGQGSLVVAD